VDGNSKTVNLAEYDVVRNADDKVMNDKPISIRAAERLLLTLPKVAPSPEERKPIVDSVAKIKWRKLGGGSFRMKSGKIIKPNQVFEASLDEIPAAFRDVIVPVDKLPEELPLEVVGMNYTVVSKGPGWYNVIDAQGKVVNEKSLRLPEAKALMESLVG
jgi:hypothetical protein